VSTADQLPRPRIEPELMRPSMGGGEESVDTVSVFLKARTMSPQGFSFSVFLRLLLVVEYVVEELYR